MTLLEAQMAFAVRLGHLFVWLDSNGYGVTIGEGYRPPVTAEYYASQGMGIVDSLHCSRLAQDLNLFKDGVFLTNKDDYAPAGEYWESLTDQNIVTCWGGRFLKPDSDHFSIAWGGKK